VFGVVGGREESDSFAGLNEGINGTDRLDSTKYHNTASYGKSSRIECLLF
jgi:hypothetical protein